MHTWHFWLWSSEHHHLKPRPPLWKVLWTLEHNFIPDQPREQTVRMSRGVGRRCSGQSRHFRSSYRYLMLLRNKFHNKPEKVELIVCREQRLTPITKLLLQTLNLHRGNQPLTCARLPQATRDVISPESSGAALGSPPSPENLQRSVPRRHPD